METTIATTTIAPASTLENALSTMVAAQQQYGTVTSPGRLLYVGAIGKHYMERADYDALTEAGYMTMIPCAPNAYSQTAWQPTDKLKSYCTATPTEPTELTETGEQAPDDLEEQETPTGPAPAVTVDGKILIDALKFVKGAVAKSFSLPILSNVKLDNDGSGTLYVTATNLETAMESMAVPADSTGPFSITVPYRLFTDSLNPKSAATLTYREEAAKSGKPGDMRVKLDILQGKVSTTLNGIAADQFPVVPAATGEPVAYVAADVLADVARDIAFAASADTSRPVLASVYVKLGDRVTFAAADGFRLARRAVSKNVVCADECELLIPATAFPEIAKLVGMVSVYLSKHENRPTSAVFVGDNGKVTTRLIEGKYVDIDRVTPTDWATRFVLSCQDFTDALKALKPYARDSAQIVRMEYTDGSLALTAKSEGVGSRTVTVDATAEGTPMQWAGNLTFLMDVAATLKGDIALTFKTPGAPTTLQPLNDPDTIHVVMPMYLANR